MSESKQPKPPANVWLVKHPIGQYNEDVKSLARKAGLEIVDAIFSDAIPADRIAKKVPELTKIGSKPKAEKPKDEPAA